MDNSWKGTAIVGVWIGAGLVCLFTGPIGVFAALFACMATMLIADA